MFNELQERIDTEMTIDNFKTFLNTLENDDEIIDMDDVEFCIIGRFLLYLGIVNVDMEYEVFYRHLRLNGNEHYLMPMWTSLIQRNFLDNNKFPTISQIKNWVNQQDNVI